MVVCMGGAGAGVTTAIGGGGFERGRERGEAGVV